MGIILLLILLALVLSRKAGADASDGDGSQRLAKVPVLFRLTPGAKGTIIEQDGTRLIRVEAPFKGGLVVTFDKSKIQGRRVELELALSSFHRIGIVWLVDEKLWADFGSIPPPPDLGRRTYILRDQALEIDGKVEILITPAIADKDGWMDVHRVEMFTLV